MKYLVTLIMIIILSVGGYYMYNANKKPVETFYPSPAITVSPTTTPASQVTITTTPYPDTQHAISAILAAKYSKPLSEVKVKVNKEVPGFASGTVLFGKGGPGESGAWLAYLGNGWNVVWDGNGSVDCTKMRNDYGFPDTILKPNFCD